MLPVAGQTGTTTITLTASDGVASATSQFLVTVGPNEPPLIAPLADLQAIEGLPLAPVQIDLSDVHSAPEDLILTVTSNSSRVLPPNRITISGTGASRTLSFQPIPSEFGTITITVMASDGLLASSRSFNLTINPGDPAVFIRKGANWAYYDSTVNPTGWQNTTYNDSAWAVGPAKLGFGEPDIVTAVIPAASRVTTYFRRSFQVADAAAYPHLRLNLVRDDGCAIWLNGQEIYRSNLPLTGTVSPSSLATTVGGAQEALDALDEVILSGIALQNGNNIIAVELHQSSTTSSDLVFDLSLEGKSIGPVSTVAPGSFWSYLDTGVAPVATWKDPAFDDAAWQRGPAKFGFGDGNEVTAISGGPDATRFVTSWFRKEFSIADAGQIRQAAIRMVRDDGAVVYLNGQEIARSNMPQGEILATTLATAAAGGADESKFFVFPIDPTRILKGKNTLAVEIHQSSVTSSDLGFDLELLTIPADSLPAPTVSLSPTQTTIVWPQWADGWLLYSSTNLQTWTRETATPVSVNGERRVILTRTPGMKYYRLALP
jgi:hypothetical protein